MKRHKVDINNLPIEEVLAINEANKLQFGYLHPVTKSGQLFTIICEGPRDTISEVTHYILKSDLLSLPEEEL